MLINDTKSDIKKLMKMEKKTQQDIADEMGLLRPSVARSMGINPVLESFVNIVEALGYDVKITYIKRVDTIASAKDILNK